MLSSLQHFSSDLEYDLVIATPWLFSFFSHSVVDMLVLLLLRDQMGSRLILWYYTFHGWLNDDMKVPWSCGSKTSHKSSTLHQRDGELVSGVCADMLICIIVKHLYFGFVCPKDIAPGSLEVCSDATFQHVSFQREEAFSWHPFQTCHTSLFFF